MLRFAGTCQVWAACCKKTFNPEVFKICAQSQSNSCMWFEVWSAWRMLAAQMWEGRNVKSLVKNVSVAALWDRSLQLILCSRQKEMLQILCVNSSNCSSEACSGTDPCTVTLWQCVRETERPRPHSIPLHVVFAYSCAHSASEGVIVANTNVWLLDYVSNY